jgi:hypothetical protein
VNPVLFVALVVACCVIVCWSAVNIPPRVLAYRRRKRAERRGGLVDFSRRRL